MNKGFDIASLKNFLKKVTDLTWAADESQYYVRGKDGSSGYLVVDGNWKYTDTFFGGEPYGGGEIVFYNKKAKWMNFYYGWVIENQDINEVYEVIKTALLKKSDALPVRGPKLLKKGDFTYKNSWKGSLKSFKGVETISKDKKIVYEASYIGGLVDLRR